MKRQVTGLQPTGTITLGNYIGAIKQMVENQDKFDSFLFVADLHAITTPQDPKALREKIRSLLALYLACGIDPEKNTIYLQSEIEFIPCISWLLECSTNFGELSRMIQFKEKSAQKSSFTAGLLTYPVLMAADILSVDADIVPVGIDQKQHVELARDIAIRFNNLRGNFFTVPEPFLPAHTAKIMDLATPEKKMSKSSESKKGVICLLDDEKSVRKKIMSATTDSDTKVVYDLENKPGISNLMSIFGALTNLSIKQIEKKFENSPYSVFKQQVFEVVWAKLSEIQQKYNEILKSELIDQILDSGKEKVRAITNDKFEKMKVLFGTVR